MCFSGTVGTRPVKKTWKKNPTCSTNTEPSPRIPPVAANAASYSVAGQLSSDPSELNNVRLQLVIWQHEATQK